MSAIRIFISSLLMIGHVYCAFDYDAPLSGKFFYAQMYNDEERGVYIRVTIGQGETQNITQNWHITTNEAMMGVIDSICIKSNLGCINTRDPDSVEGLINDTITQGHRIGGGLVFEPASFADEKKLYDNFQMEGVRMTNQYNFTLDEYRRETIIADTTSYIVYQVTSPEQIKIDLEDGITGYLGIQPYTNNVQQREFSFLYQLLYKVKFVDHLCISFYKSPEKDGLSLVKFGSYDRQGLKDNQAPKIFKTNGIEDGWSLATKTASADSTVIFDSEDSRTLQINPQFSYTYMPRVDFAVFKGHVRTHFGTAHCSENSDTCYFPQPCEVVPEFTFTLSVVVTDNTGETDTISADWHDLKADGALFGNPGTCYFGVFSNAASSTRLQSQWVVGSNMMSQKYYFFDMGPYIEQERAYFAIGMGPINPVNMIGETHYDYRSNNFMPEAKENDMSNQISGTDPYTTEQYERGHQRRTEFNSGDELPWYEANRTLLIVLAIMAVIIFITMVMLVVYCYKSRKNKLEDYEDRGLVNRLTSVNQLDTEIKNSSSINEPQYDRYGSQDVSLDAENSGNSKLDATPNKFA